MTTNTAFIREIFLSIQGEGPHIGEEQLFIRFCGCNLHCAYCDTDFEISKSKSYSPEELLSEINNFGKPMVLSLTGGEPLVSVKFLKEFLPLAKQARHLIYLETNATLPNELSEVIKYTDIISADIKLESATQEHINQEVFDKFFKIASEKEVFAKLVFNKTITDSEINFAINLAKKYNFGIILQPEMIGNRFSITTTEMENIFKTFRTKYTKVRLIPQMHKFIDVR